jgi:hypothetical protein
VRCRNRHPRESDCHGSRIDDDLFIVAGRANWILQALTFRTFGSVDFATDPKAELGLQDHWRRYLAGEEIGDVYRP